MITGSVHGGTEVVERFQRLPETLRGQLRTAVAKLTIGLQNSVKAKLDGEVLKRRTGRLRNSIGQTITGDGDVVTGIVSTALEYARTHEYGFDGQVSVRSHMRTIKQAFGRSINPVTFEVRAYDRHAHLPERSFLRSSLRQLEASGEIGRQIGAAVKEGLA